MIFTSTLNYSSTKKQVCLLLGKINTQHLKASNEKTFQKINNILT